MIVKCEQCQTRFKIPDEKVTDKGVKVRCTKCGHTFRVTRESVASPSGTSTPAVPPPGAAPSDSGFDPFERFGTAPEPPKGNSTKPGFFAEGVEATKAPTPPAPPAPESWNNPDAGVEQDFFQETTRVIPLQVPPEARPPVPSLPPLPFDLPPATGAPGGAGLRQSTPAPGQGLSRPGAVPFKPTASGPAPLPGVPSVAPSMAPLGARSLPTLPPVKPPVPGARPLGGAAPSVPRTLAPPAMSVPGPSAPASSARPGVKPLAPAPAPAAAPAAPDDLFSEFFAKPAGGPAPRAPLPKVPPPGMQGLSPVAAQAPAPAWPAPAHSSLGAEEGEPFGSVSGELGEPPPDLGPAPEFDPTAMFSDPAPVAPPMPPAAGRPAAPLGRPPVSATPAPAPRGLAPAAIPPAPAPRMAPPAMAPAPAPSAPASFGDDPFGSANVDLGEPPADEFGFGAAPAPAPAFAPAPASAEPLSFADEDPFGSQGAELGGPAEAPAESAPDPFAPPEPMGAPGADEFGPSFGGGMPQEQAAPSAPDVGFAPPGPMDFGMVGDEQFPPPSEPMAAPQGMSDPFAAPAEGMADPFGAPAESMADPFGAPAEGMSDPFAAPAPGGGIPDPFATAEPAFSPTMTGRQKIGPSEGFLTQTDTSHQVISPTETGRHMLDLPAHEGAEPGPGEEFGATGSRELIDLPSQPSESAPAERPAPTLASPAIARPAGRPADMGIPERRKVSAAQAVTGQVAYLTIAAGLLLALTAVGGVYMKEGKVDASALSPDQLLKMLTPSQFAMRDVTNGLYDTRGSTPIFYVRGEVENRSSKPARVKVQAALYDGGQRVKSAEGLAGLSPTPEELHAITSAEAAAQLRTRLDAEATVIEPGKRAPFTLVLQEYPKDLSAFRLRVTMEAVPEGESQP
ncbi:zinc-ribbon domain-containing protein [Hyalangium sp.]|uniref:zinc-ribbon domain-containing protein n=1 Tax=Hyalangium sp. TaxID=2028555 RepID=UPI002D354FA0|nr:zinc-ribbon domain-containing protein [Hyalangium sp.]HYH95758.1 zinc-ribbon domain-containing protein [Hyalangium sp.]